MTKTRTRLTTAQKAELWESIRPALVQAWELWRQLYLGFGCDMERALEGERALFNRRPSLYIGYRGLETPGMRHGTAENLLINAVSKHCRDWGIETTLRGLEDYLGVNISRRAGK